MSHGPVAGGESGSYGVRGVAESGVGTPWRRAENIRYDDNVRQDYKVLHRRLSHVSRRYESGVRRRLRGRGLACGGKGTIQAAWCDARYHL
jgi:hypothetical protein